MITYTDNISNFLSDILFAILLVKYNILIIYTLMLNMNVKLFNKFYCTRLRNITPNSANQFFFSLKFTDRRRHRHQLPTLKEFLILCIEPLVKLLIYYRLCSSLSLFPITEMLTSIL